MLSLTLHNLSFVSEKYKIGDPQTPHFITITVVKWLPIFKEVELSKIILDSLQFCQKNKGLIINAWCIMPSHVHLIICSNKDISLSSIIRDFKKYTSIAITGHINKTDNYKRYLKVFEFSGMKSSKHDKYKVWQEGYHPIELSRNLMLDQRLEYLHYNPVIAGLVETPEEYELSSATNYYLTKTGPLQLEFIT